MSSGDAVEAVSSEAQAPALTLEQLNSALGKNFKDVETAVKSVKDTFSYVGSKVEKVEEELKSQGFISKREFEELLFYRDNPEYGQYKEVIDAFAQRSGVSPAEAVKSDVLAGLIGKAKEADRFQNTQSVIDTNPRLVASRDGLAQARENVRKEGRVSEGTTSAVVKAVLDAYEE